MPLRPVNHEQTRMKSAAIRTKFLEFFESRSHRIVPSAPIVNKADPSLMFTNAGMNQFKDFFLGNEVPPNRRIADTQKCLRVSGKHNDLEEVGRDSYHHTMFEMLGNWSVGDYFKQEAIDWAWELLVDVFGVDKERIYITIFEGDTQDGLPADEEAASMWERHLPAERILRFGKKDNFWEMGDTGPCGPCSEIHYDLRDDEIRRQTPGASLVNQDNPLVVEIWNLVFIQFNRLASGRLEALPEKHVDTGMGFERLCMVLQGKSSNYDTDVFTPFIQAIERASGKTYSFSYEPGAKTDIAMRVVADHIRAVAFTIADGQLPSNTGAGYVIRRILRRAVRYYFSFLDIKEPFLHTLIPLLAQTFQTVFPELYAQQDQVATIIKSEESAFLQTLDNGLKRFEILDTTDAVINGKDAFELYDTFGFPIDLTRLLASEKGLKLDERGFEEALRKQKERSRADAKKAVGDWHEVRTGGEVEFVGYDQLEVNLAQILKYRTVEVKGKNEFQLVLNQTPFYAESGGQAGDTGTLRVGNQIVRVIDTQKENNLIIHRVDQLPEDMTAPVTAEVDSLRRQAVSCNHSATHLMHAALHKILGNHAVQKGQDVDDQRIRFDFNHFQKVDAAELIRIEDMVNEKIRANITLEEARDVPIQEAQDAGAMMLFGEKYGDVVRMITFDPSFSRELCGGTHVSSTGEIGLFKIISEGAVAAGVRRIEAVTALQAESFLRGQLNLLDEIKELFKNPQHLVKQVSDLIEENKTLRKEIDGLRTEQAMALKEDLRRQAQQVGPAHLLVAHLPLNDGAALKSLAFQLENEIESAVIVFGAVINDKPQLMIAIDKSLCSSHGLHAGNLVRTLAASHIQGGGGGQPFFATAGGKDSAGLDAALAEAKSLLTEALSK